MKFQAVGRGDARETNDCVVRALQNATGITYKQAHLLAAQAGRRFGGKTQWDTVTKLYNPLGQCSKTDESVERFVSSRPSGTYIAYIRGHVFAVKDGVIMDMGQPRAGSRVTIYWNIVNKPELPKMVQEFESVASSTGAIPPHIQAILQGKLKAAQHAY